MQVKPRARQADRGRAAPGRGQGLKRTGTRNLHRRLKLLTEYDLLSEPNSNLDPPAHVHPNWVSTGARSVVGDAAAGSTANTTNPNPPAHVHPNRVPTGVRSVTDVASSVVTTTNSLVPHRSPLLITTAPTISSSDTKPPPVRSVVAVRTPADMQSRTQGPTRPQ